MIVYGIDPGEKESAVVGWDGEKITYSAERTNQDVISDIVFSTKSLFAIEQLRGYGLKSGNETFETIWWSGRFFEAANGRAVMIPRKDILVHITDNRKAGDTEIRQALLDKIGPKGTKKQPGPMFGISGTHLFSALAVAVTHFEKMMEANNG